jgi:hypothetical protein
MTQRSTSRRRLRPLTVLSLLMTLLSLVSTAAWAQTRALITEHVDENTLVKLPGGLPPQLAKAQDLGPADVSQPSGGLMLVLKRSSAQQAALESFLEETHEKSSPSFHKWLAPGQFAGLYGASPDDVQQLTAWMQGQGLTVGKTAAGNMAIEFSGTIGQVDTAFHTSIHAYSLNGTTHYASATAASIPAAFAPAVTGVSGLNDFRPQPQIKVMGQAAYNAKTHTGVPQWTYPEGTGNAPLYFLTPEDFATQYDVKPVYAAGLTGAGETIGIINDSNIDISLVNAFRSLFGLAANPPQVVVDGNNPGINGDSVEAYLDVENAGAIAPQATIKLYISGSFGYLGHGGLTFALARAVDDDTAQVLSTSFGTCEAAGTATNQFFNAAWAQAAAQGQTAFVSAGDSGSFDDCYGLGVNGIASTPWNVAVGGTDVYTPDYASGGSSITTYWSDTNDANLGSLQQPMQEQPWNATQFGLNSTTYDPLSKEITVGGAGSGGASSCTISTFDSTTFLPVCTAKYAKPSWQVGIGVPNDAARDLPDVSLFAANAPNGVIWPICAEPGDCSETDPASQQLYVTGVGGTSASSPAMAGIMALIDQKYGSQGQADFTLYPLAAQFPAAFHDITVGSNNYPCASYEVGNEIDCTLDADGDGYDSLGRYSATAGYDLASGLGSIDANVMIADWGKITFQPSATILTLSPSTLTHGETATAFVAVTGTGTPSGIVGLVASTTLPNSKGVTGIQLGATGTATSTLNFLPGGTYTLIAQYSGDGINAASSSQPVNVTVNPEASTLAFAPQYFNPNTFNPAPITPNAAIVYGSDLLMDVQVNGAAGTYDGSATGTVTFTDGSTTLAVIPVSASGTAEYDGSRLAVGSHSVSVSYSGDASFKASTAPPVAFAVVQSASSGFLVADNAAKFDSQGNASYPVGASPEFTCFIQSANESTGLQPTGTATLQIGSNPPVTVPVVPDQNLSIFGNVSVASTVFANLQAGTYTVTATYSGDANFSGSTTSTTVDVTPSTLLNSTTTFTTTPTDLTTATPSTVITLNMTVTGSGTVAPTGTVTATVANLFGFAPVTLVPGTGNTSTATMTFRAEGLLPGNNSLSVNYSGDSIYNGSNSVATVAYDDPTDFSIQTQTPNLVIPSGSTGVANVNLSSFNGFTGAVAVTCAAPQYLSCSVGSSSVTLNGAAASTTVSINTVTPDTPPATASAKHTGKGWLGSAGGSLFACVLLLVLPKRHRFGRTMLGLLACILMLGSAIGCGGGNNPNSTAPKSPANQSAAAGTYTVVVTGTSAAGVIHNTAISVIVQ